MAGGGKPPAHGAELMPWGPAGTSSRIGPQLAPWSALARITRLVGDSSFDDAIRCETMASRFLLAPLGSMG